MGYATGGNATNGNASALLWAKHPVTAMT